MVDKWLPKAILVVFNQPKYDLSKFTHHGLATKNDFDPFIPKKLTQIWQ
jgi:hypothetical protein